MILGLLLNGCSQTQVSIETSTTPEAPPSIQGHVMFQDGTPGSGVTILLSQPNKENYITNINIIDETTTDSQGNYEFYDVPDGTYWLDEVTNNTYIDNEATAVVKVTSGTTTNVVRMAVYEDLYMGSINNIKYSQDDTLVVSGHSFTFNWTKLNNATYYTVEVFATHNQTNSSNIDYDNTITATSNNITWPIDLSTIPCDGFRVDIMAYTSNNILVAQNDAWFDISY